MLAAAAAAAPAWRVRAHAEINATVLRLGDLLAPGEGAALPPELRHLALAAAPQPGMPLRWSRAQLEARLRSAGVPPRDFVIPAAIEIERRAAPVPVAAVLAALRTVLHRPLTARDVSFLAPLTTAAQPEVKVLRTRPDIAHGRLEVICRAQNDPALLPFSVSVRVPTAELTQQTRQRWLRSRMVAARPTMPLAARPAPAPMVVRPGQIARLSISDPGFALVTLVEPLQPGRAGDIIRVRSLATHAVLRVRVTGPDQVSSLPNALATPPQESPHAPR